MEKIDKIKAAIQAYQKLRYKDAIDIWFNFPDAHVRLIFDLYKKEPDRQKHEFDKILQTEVGKSYKVLIAYAIWHYQNAKYEEALKLFDEILSTYPNEDLFVYAGWTLERLGRYREAMMAFQKAIQLNPQKWTECMNWIGHCAAQLPTWDERAEEQIKEQLFQQVDGKSKIKLNDPYMDKKE